MLFTLLISLVSKFNLLFLLNGHIQNYNSFNLVKLQTNIVVLPCYLFEEGYSSLELMNLLNLPLALEVAFSTNI